MIKIFLASYLTLASFLQKSKLCLYDQHPYFKEILESEMIQSIGVRSSFGDNLCDIIYF